MKIEKNPGPDWLVEYEFEEGDGESNIMSVFGQLTIDDALKEAHDSLSFKGFVDNGPYTILGIRRLKCN